MRLFEVKNTGEIVVLLVLTALFVIQVPTVLLAVLVLCVCCKIVAYCSDHVSPLGLL